jgi:hypothetical protein
MIKSAILSDCGNYRYRLSRIWDTSERPVCFLMLNPSTADDIENDATIRKCMGFAERWSAGGIVVVNLFAWRATEPDDMKGYGPSAVGPENDRHIRAAIIECKPLVCAWGVHGAHLGRDVQVKELIRRSGLPWGMCLGTTKDGHPRHPLFVPYAAELVKFDPVVKTTKRSNVPESGSLDALKG